MNKRQTTHEREARVHGRKDRSKERLKTTRCCASHHFFIFFFFPIKGSCRCNRIFRDLIEGTRSLCPATKREGAARRCYAERCSNSTIFAGTHEPALAPMARRVTDVVLDDDSDDDKSLADIITVSATRRSTTAKRKMPASAQQALRTGTCQAAVEPRAGSSLPRQAAVPPAASPGGRPARSRWSITKSVSRSSTPLYPESSSYDLQQIMVRQFEALTAVLAEQRRETKQKLDAQAEATATLQASVDKVLAAIAGLKGRHKMPVRVHLDSSGVELEREMPRLPNPYERLPKPAERVIVEAPTPTSGFRFSPTTSTPSSCASAAPSASAARSPLMQPAP